MGLVENGYINLKSDNEKGHYDLEVKVNNSNSIAVRTDILADNGMSRYNVCFSIQEIEALYNFAQILKTNN